MSYIYLETGDKLLLETGDKWLLDQNVVTDSGAGTEEVSRPIREITDSGTGVDSAGVPISWVDTGDNTYEDVDDIWTPHLDAPAEQTEFTKTVTDSGAGTDEAQVSTRVIADSGTGTDEPQVSTRVVTDSGEGTDEVQNAARVVSDSGTGTDEIQNSSRVVADSGTGTDQLLGDYSKDITETGSGVDEVQNSTRDITDSGTGTDEAQVSARMIADSGEGTDEVQNAARVVSDSGTGVDEAQNSVRLVTDSGAGTDDVSRNREVLDSGTGTDEAQNSVRVVADSGAGVDEVQNATREVTDSSSGVDEAQVSARVVGDSSTGTDSIFGLAASSVVVADSGAGTDVPQVSTRVITDSGSGTDDAQVAFKVAEDTGTGTDSIGGLDASSVIVTDDAAGSDEAIMSGPTELTKEVTDSGSGADELVFPFKVLAVLDSGDGTEVIPVAAAVLITVDQSTNVCEYPRSFGSWNNNLTPTALQDQDGLDGVSNTAWTLGDDSAAGTEYKMVQTSAGFILNDSLPVCFSVFVKKDTDETRFPEIALILTGGASQYCFLRFNTKTGENNAFLTAGTYVASVDSYNATWWRVWVTVYNNSTGNTTLGYRVHPAGSAVITGSQQNAAIGTVVVDAAQVELNKSSPSDYSFPASDVVGGLSANAGMEDTGTGTDATLLQASGQVAESSSGTDSVYGLAAASVIVSDTAGGTDSVYGLAASSVVAADSAAGADTVYNVTRSNAVIEDVGAGTDATPLRTVSQVTDSGSGTDLVFGLAAIAGVTDSAVGTESIVVPEATLADIWVDTVDTVYVDLDSTWAPHYVLAAFKSVTDSTGAGTDLAAVKTVNAGVADGGTGIEAIVKVGDYIVTVADSGTCLDWIDLFSTRWQDEADSTWVDADDVWRMHSGPFYAAVTIVIADSGAGIDLPGVMAGVGPIADSLAGTDSEVQRFLTWATDSGEGTDTLFGLVALALVSDDGTGTEIVTLEMLARLVTITDSGTGTDEASLMGFVFTDTMDAFVFVDDYAFQFIEHRTISIMEDFGTGSDTVAIAVTSVIPSELSWVQHLYGAEGFSCYSNCVWDGDSFNWAGPGLAISPGFGKTWHIGFRPTKVRITYGTGSGGNNYLWGAGKTIATLVTPAGGGTVEANIDWTVPGAGDIDRFNLFDADIITNIEFLSGALAAGESGLGSDSVALLTSFSKQVFDDGTGTDEIALSNNITVVDEAVLPMFLFVVDEDFEFVSDADAEFREIWSDQPYVSQLVFQDEAGTGTETIASSSSVLVADSVQGTDIPENAARIVYDSGTELVASNICSYPRNFGAWLNNQTPIALQNQVGIDGVADIAWTLGDDSATTNEYKLIQTAPGFIPNDSLPICFSVFVKKDADETRFPAIALILVGGASQYCFLRFNTKTGAKNAFLTAGTYATSVESYDATWWRVWVTVYNNSTGNTTLGYRVYPASSTVLTGSDQNATQGTIVVDAAQVELNRERPSICDIGVRVAALVSDTAAGGDAARQSTRLVITDSAAGSDAASPIINPIVYDSVAGTEARIVQASAQVVDSAIGDQIIIRFGDIEKQVVDFGTGLEAILIDARGGLADDGAGSDAPSTWAIASAVDSGAGADESLVPTVSAGLTDSSLGTAAVLISAFAAVEDAALLTDLVLFRQMVGVNDSADGVDEAIAAELFLVKVLAEDNGIGTDSADALQVSSIVFSDSFIGTDRVYGLAASSVIATDSSAGTDSVYGLSAFTKIATDAGTAVDEFVLNIDALVISDSAFGADFSYRNWVEKFVDDSGAGSDAVSFVRPYEAIWMVSSRTAKIVADSYVEMDFGGASAMSSRVITGFSELMIQRAANER